MVELQCLHHKWCVSKCVYLCEWGFAFIWYTYCYYYMYIWLCGACMCLSCMWFFICVGLGVSVFVSGMDIKLNNVFQNVCCSLDPIQSVFLRAIRSKFRHFSPLSTEGPSCWKISALWCRHAMSFVEGCRVVIKQGQLHGLVRWVWAHGRNNLFGGTGANICCRAPVAPCTHKVQLHTAHCR